LVNADRAGYVAFLPQIWKKCAAVVRARLTG
jgi:hypothetical protein